MGARKKEMPVLKENEKRNKGGRPPKYKTELDFDKVCRIYFARLIETDKMPNKAGLLLELDISRPVYADYKKKFPDTIKRAENIIENAWVQRLSGNAATGAIFYLKNAFHLYYRDRRETDITSGGEPLKGIEINVRKDSKL